METMEIQNSHSLLTSIPNSFPIGARVYQVSCRELASTNRNWLKSESAQGYALGVRTVGFERSWHTATEIEQVAATIQTRHWPIALG